MCYQIWLSTMSLWQCLYLYLSSSLFSLAHVFSRVSSPSIVLFCLFITPYSDWYYNDCCTLSYWYVSVLVSCLVYKSLILTQTCSPEPLSNFLWPNVTFNNKFNNKQHFALPTYSTYSNQLDCVGLHLKFGNNSIIRRLPCWFWCLLIILQCFLTLSDNLKLPPWFSNLCYFSGSVWPFSPLANFITFVLSVFWHSDHLIGWLIILLFRQPLRPTRWWEPLVLGAKPQKGGRV